MFLDDELLEMCKNKDVNTSNEIQALYADVMKSCENYYKSKLHPFMTKKEVKIILHKTFNLFDSFVRKAKKHPSNKIQAFGELFEKYSFKRAFLDNPKMKKLYNEL